MKKNNKAHKKKHKKPLKQQAIKQVISENADQHQLHHKLIEEQKNEFLNSTSFQLHVTQSLLILEDIMGLKLLLKLDIGEQCLINTLETMPKTKALTAILPYCIIF